jgi:hypothetical protein
VAYVDQTPSEGALGLQVQQEPAHQAASTAQQAHHADRSPEPPRKSRTVPVLVGALAVTVVVAAGLAVALFSDRSAAPSTAAPAATAPAQVPSASAPSPHITPGAAFRTVQSTCDLAAGYDIEDEGQTLELQSGPLYLSSDQLNCVFTSLDMPEALLQHVNSTRAIDGQQTDSWDGYTARWTYYPDAGLQMTIRMA